MCSIYVNNVSGLLYLCTVAPYDVTISAADDDTDSVIVKYGDLLVLYCNTSGGPDNMFRWFKDNVLLESDSTLDIMNVDADDGGIYECVVNNTAGSSSDYITVYGEYCLSVNIIVCILYFGFSYSTFYY